MKRLLAYSVGAAALVAVSSAGSAATLLDLTDIPVQFVTPKNIVFTASSTSTMIDFQGYDVPGSLAVVNILLAATGNTTNLLGTNFSYTAAACNPFALQGADVGTHGSNNLIFGGYCEGSYDSFAQTVSTSIGASYTLSFALSSISAGSPVPNGLRVFATDANAIGAVPEPASWAMMLLGFGAIGFQMRRRKPVLRLA